MTDINVSFDQPQIVVQFPDTPTQTIYWGNILGVLADQTDLVTALSLRMLKSANLSDVADVSTARSNLGLGSIATQNSNNVAITGGSITGMSTPVNPSDVATKGYADSLLGANDAMVFKGVIDCSANPNYPAADAGHTYKISVAGKIGGASGVDVEVGDTIYCITDGSVAGTQVAVGANRVIVQNNIDTATLLLKANNLSDLTNAATARSNLGLVIGTDVQAQNANLSAIAGLTSAADKIAYFTGAGTAALADFTSFGRQIVATVNSAAVCALLGLVIGSTVQAYDANTTILGNTTTGTGAIVRDVSPTLTTPNIGAAVATSITASGSGGFLIESNSGTDVALFGAGGGSNATFYGGVSLSTFTQGSIVFAGSGGLLSQDNSSFYFDDTNNRVGLLTTAPTHTLTLGSTSTGITIYNTADQTTNIERGVIQRNSNILEVGTQKAGTGSNRAVRFISASGHYIQISTGSSPWFNFTATAAGTGSIVQISGSHTQSSGNITMLSIAPTFNQTSTAGWTVLDLNPTVTASGSGSLNFILCRKASGTTLFGVDSNGGLIANRIIVPSGTTTPVTITAGDTNKVYTNEGATAKITYNLPAAAAGLTYTFIVQDADGMDITAATGDTIRRNTNVTAAGGTVNSSAIGSVLVLVAINATEWIATSEIGTWA